MTALAAVWTPEGFVIGADGRRLLAQSSATVSDSVQKILPAFCENVYAACGIAGAGGFTSPQGFEFSTFAEVKKIIGGLAKQKFATPLAYAWEIADRLYLRILAETQDTIPSEQMLNSTFVSLLIVGYAGPNPALAQIIIPHSNRKVLPPKWDKYRIKNFSDFVISSGSEQVRDDMVQAGQFNPPTTLNEAADLVHFYISECIRHNTDYKDCVGIGGYIHLAAVKPDGFAWGIPPLQSE